MQAAELLDIQKEIQEMKESLERMAFANGNAQASSLQPKSPHSGFLQTSPAACLAKVLGSISWRLVAVV